MLLGAGCQDIFILAPKRYIEVDESIEIHGLHIFSNNESEFIIYNNDVEQDRIKGKNILFSSQQEGDFNIEFRAKNLESQWISSNIHIVVRKNIINKDLPLLEEQIQY